MGLWQNLQKFWQDAEPVAADAWPPPSVDDGTSDDGEAARAKSPVAAPLHIMAGSALVRIDNGVVVVERANEPKFERPIELVSAVHIHGWATITSPCVAALLHEDIPVLWRGPNGYPVGIAQPMHKSGIEARRAQYTAAAGPTGLLVAKAIVAAKIVNMRSVVRRRAAHDGRDCMDSLAHLSKRAGSAETIDTLLGIEGAATAQYFSAFPYMIAARAGDVSFNGRTRRPPQDEINTLLSYCYAILAGECVAAVAAAGLDPRQGFLHKVRAGRPSLALDMMEPFRPLIADQAVLGGLNFGQLKPDNFIVHEHSVTLTETGRRLAVDVLEKRFASALTLTGRSEPVTWRELIGISSRSLADALRNNRPFEPVERG